MKCCHRNGRREKKTVGQDGALRYINVMQCVPLSNGVDCAGGRRVTDLFEGTPHVHRGGVLTEVPPAAAFRSNDGIPKGPFGYVESSTILGGQSALPAMSSTKMCLPELCEVG